MIEQFERKEMPERYSTNRSYKSMIDDYIRPKWKDVQLKQIKPVLVEEWLKSLTCRNKRKKGSALAPKTRAHIRSLMHLMFQCAMRWELATTNPIALVRVNCGSKRKRRPRVISVEQFSALLQLLPEPYRTMVVVAMCLGLRVGEIVGLKWSDFDFENLTLIVQRSVVHGREDFVKTEYSNELLPLDASLLAVLDEWRAKTEYRSSTDWVFTSPSTGCPYHQESIQKNYLRPGGKKVGFEDSLGWHTFRHTYRSLLDDTDAPMSVQKELMRHANIQTTMDVYGKSSDRNKRHANQKVVQMVLPKAQTDSEQYAVSSGQ